MNILSRIFNHKAFNLKNSNFNVFKNINLGNIFYIFNQDHDVGTDDVFQYDVNVNRKEYKILREILKSTSVLLLTGVSQCGKTHSAKFVASEFQQKGYICKFTDNIEEAKRYLLSTANQKRICILDDPLGHLDLNENGYNIYSEINNTINQLSDNRLLIVTSRLDILLKVIRKSSIAECNIGKHKWFDLTVNDYNYFTELLNAYIDDKNVIKSIMKKINSLKRSKNLEILQPGQILNLSNIEKSKLLNMEYCELKHEACIDAHELGNKLDSRNEYCTKLLCALALGADTIHPINVNELSFMLSGIDNYPSILIEERVRVSTLGGVGNVAEFPQYQYFQGLDENYVSELDFLEQSKYIIRKSNNIFFRHPVYEEAAKHILLNQSYSMFMAIVSIFNRGIGALDSSVTSNCMKKVGFLYDSYSENADYQSIIIKSTLMGIKSIFPMTQYYSVVFLLRVFDILEKENKEKLIRMLITDDVNFYGLLWNNDQAWFDISDVKSAFSWFEERDYYMSFKGEAMKLESIILNESVTGITKKGLWDYVNYLAINDDLNEKYTILMELMNSEEYFIREKAAFLLISSYINEDTLEIVFKDEHPRVIYQGIRGCVKVWLNISDSLKQKLLPLIIEKIEDRFVAGVTAKLMIEFYDEYKDESVICWSELDEKDKLSMWKLWAEIYPVFMNSLPIEFVHINLPHLNYNIEQAINYISSKQGVNISKAWYNYILELSKYTEPDDYGLGVVDFLLKTTKCESELRRELFYELITCNNTSIITSNVAYLVDFWDLLDCTEKGAIVDLLKSQRNDILWIRAVAITRRNVPTEIQLELTHQYDLLESSPQKIVCSIDDDLLDRALCVYCGYPQPLWLNGYHHTYKELWDRIVIQVLDDPSHISFRIALREFVSHIVHGEEIIDKDITWTKLCQNKDETFNRSLFDFFLKESVGVVTPKTAEYWKIFFDNNSNPNVQQLYQKIAEYSAAIECRGKVIYVFGKEFFYYNLLPIIQPDYTIFKFLIEMYKIEDLIGKSNLDGNVPTTPLELFIKIIEKQYKTEQLKLRFTCDAVKRFLNSHENIPNDITSLIDCNLEYIKRYGEEIIETTRQNEISIKNWNYTYCD